MTQWAVTWLDWQSTLALRWFDDDLVKMDIFNIFCPYSLKPLDSCSSFKACEINWTIMLWVFFCLMMSRKWQIIFCLMIVDQMCILLLVLTMRYKEHRTNFFVVIFGGYRQWSSGYWQCAVQSMLVQSFSILKLFLLSYLLLWFGVSFCIQEHFYFLVVK